MQQFKNLDREKQNQIINSAMKIFGSNSYQKAYMSEIASSANVSKASLFYYFNSKFELYSFILSITKDELVADVDVADVSDQQDFFECLRQASVYKMESLRKRPYLTKFLTKFFFETDPAISDLRLDFMQISEQLRNQIVFENLDTTRFKDSVDPHLVMDMLVKWSEGYMVGFEKIVDRSTTEETNAFFDKMIADFHQLMDMLQINFYKD